MTAIDPELHPPETGLANGPGPGDAAWPRRLLRLQILVVLLCTMINMLDGYDLLAISFTAPRIAAEWRVAPAALGLVFGVGLVGIGAGSLILAPIADRRGRRPAILLGLVLLSIGMLGVWLSTSLLQLAALRFVTGLGIGTLLPSINTIVAEYSPPRWRGLSISLYSVGYPLGATLSGSVAFFIIERFGWRSIYLCGGLASLLLLPAVARLMPESMAFLSQPQRRRPAALLARGLRGPTVLICAAFFLLWTTSFFVQNWNPTILAREGAARLGAASGLLLNIGGICGSLLFGVASARVKTGWLTAVYLFAGFLAALVFATLPVTRPPWILACSFGLGFCLIGCVVGLCATAADAFPSDLRASGTGAGLAAGRAGAALGVFLGGVLVGIGWTRLAYYSALALPALGAALAVLALHRRLRAEPPPRLELP